MDLNNLIERLVWCLDDRAPEEEVDAAVVEALEFLDAQDVSLDREAFESRIATADWRHMCERTLQLLSKNNWALHPKKPKGWDVIDEDGNVLAGHRNPAKAVLRAAGFHV